MCLIPPGLWVGVLTRALSQLTVGLKARARTSHSVGYTFPLVRVALAGTLQQLCCAINTES